jgi:hypothetical protein
MASQRRMGRILSVNTSVKNETPCFSGDLSAGRTEQSCSIQQSTILVAIGDLPSRKYQ